MLVSADPTTELNNCGMTMKTRYSFFAVLILVASLLISCKTMKEYDAAVTAAVDSLRRQHAPDGRVAVFDVAWKRTPKGILVKGEVDNIRAKEDLLAAIGLAGELATIDSLRVLPDSSLGDRIFGIVTLSVANVRSKPAQSAELATQAMMGTVVKLLKYQWGYYFAQLPDNYLGWIEDDAVKVGNKQEVEVWRSSPKVIATGYFGVVRSEPSTSALPVCDVVAGALLKHKGTRGSWIAVELADGRAGYIEEGGVEEYAKWKRSRALNGDNIEKVAKMFVGIPYLWGGTSPKGVDCSGFTKIVYRLNGLELNRDADQQSYMGEEVPLDDDFKALKKGDLLFFGRKSSPERPERITHVGIYLENKKFIHSSGRVKLNSFDPKAPDFDEGNLKRLVRSRRLVGTVQIPEVAQN